MEIRKRELALYTEALRNRWPVIGGTDAHPEKKQLKFPKRSALGKQLFGPAILAK